MSTLTIPLEIPPLVTPIRKIPNSKSYIDYNEQMERSMKNEQVMWDDGKGNLTTKPGGLFGFIHNGISVEFHIITNIISYKDRLESWSSNIGHNDRNVLYLSECILTITWDDWLHYGGHKKVLGTCRVLSNADKINYNIRGRLGNIVWSPETNELIYLKNI